MDDEDKEDLCSEEDIYYDVLDNQQGVISFRKEHPTYLTLKSCLLTVGIDIDEVDTEQKLSKCEIKHHELLSDYVVHRILSRSSKSIEAQLVRAILNDDEKQVDLLSDKLNRKKLIGLKLV